MVDIGNTLVLWVLVASPNIRFIYSSLVNYSVFLYLIFCANSLFNFNWRFFIICFDSWHYHETSLRDSTRAETLSHAIRSERVRLALRVRDRVQRVNGPFISSWIRSNISGRPITICLISKPTAVSALVVGNSSWFWSIVTEISRSVKVHILWLIDVLRVRRSDETQILLTAWDILDWVRTPNKMMSVGEILASQIIVLFFIKKFSLLRDFFSDYML